MAVSVALRAQLSRRLARFGRERGVRGAEVQTFASSEASRLPYLLEGSREYVSLVTANVVFFLFLPIEKASSQYCQLLAVSYEFGAHSSFCHFLTVYWCRCFGCLISDAFLMYTVVELGDQCQHIRWFAIPGAILFIGYDGITTLKLE